MYLGLKASFLGHTQLKLCLMCFMLALGLVFGTVFPQCSFAEVAAAEPCLEAGNTPAEDQCRTVHHQCCIAKMSKKCYRRKIQPNSGICLQAPILISRPSLNTFLEGDAGNVILETKTVSELQCWDSCLRHAHCKAYNYQHSVSELLKTCQLLSSEVGMPVARKDFTYHIIAQTENKQVLLGNMCH